MKTPARRFFSIFLAIIMALSTQIFCFCADVLAEAPIIYVSPDGNDTSGDGTSDAPFATLKKAFSKIFSVEIQNAVFVVLNLRLGHSLSAKLTDNGISDKRAFVILRARS